MIQFNEEDLIRLRERGKRQPEVVGRIKEKVGEIMEEPVLAPKTGIANWFLYYYCPKCSVQLRFDRQHRHHHQCPVCKRVLTGEPYDSTWWGIINSRNYTAAYHMALIYLITGEENYARKAADIMKEYSKYYKGYEVHGDIPYNGPGKAGAQTLDEANFLRSFAMAYDLLSDYMTTDEKEKIQQDMLLPGAEFLIEHRHNQLHNHEVIINSAIAIIGLIFNQEDYIDFAVYEPYGLLYQLEKGMLSNHMWFEGAFGYHFYALTSFFAYEKFALHTSHSHISHPNYRAMMELLPSYLEPGFRIPMLNDTNYGHTSESLYLYEFAYREIGGDKLLYILNQLYQEEERDNLEAFVYGVDQLQGCKLPLSNYHVEEGSPGSTILRGKDGKYLLFKHDCYGGEHDHYDRLAISFLAHGRRIAPDLGTTGYGAVLHYDYYKNTGSHNTVNIGGENQPPVNAVMTRYEEKDGVIYVEAEADWTKEYHMPDSFTIVQWKEENYRTVRMRRKIAWTENWFAESFWVEGAPENLPVDWVLHISGEQKDRPEGETVEEFSDQKPYKHLHSMKCTDLKGSSENCVFLSYRDDGTKQENHGTDSGHQEIYTELYCWNQGQKVFLGKGPDNPSVSDVNYLIERSYGKQGAFAHVITAYDGISPVKQVRFTSEKEKIRIAVEERDGRWKEILM